MNMINILKKIYFKMANITIPVKSNQSKRILTKLYWFRFAVFEFFRQIMRIIYVEPIFKSICKDVGDKVIVEKIPYMLEVGDIIIGDHVTISGLIVISFNVRLFEKQEFIVGSDTFIASFSNFAIARKISIGSNCYIGNYVVIRDNDGHPLDYLERRDSLPVHREDIKPVTVGDDVWIGRGAHVLKGVTIGDRSIIGAGSIVNADVPSDCIVAGNPAKIVKRL